MLTALSFPTLYLSLELPKLIINKAIGSQDFPKTYWGFELGQIQYLAALSFAFLGLVVINGSFKYYINVFKGQAQRAHAPPATVPDVYTGPALSHSALSPGIAG